MRYAEHFAMSPLQPEDQTFFRPHQLLHQTKEVDVIWHLVAT